MADPSATTGSDLTGLGRGASVGRGTGRGRGASAGHAPGATSLGTGAAGRGHGATSRGVGTVSKGAGAAGRGLVGELPRKAMECHLLVKVLFRKALTCFFIYVWASTMLSMQDMQMVLGTSLHTRVKGTICHNGIEVRNLRLQWKDSIAFA